MDLRIRELLSADPGECVFWSGAGISANPPTSLPLGLQLTEESLENSCEPGISSRLSHYFAQAKMPATSGIKDAPRLEVVLDALYQAIGARAFEALRRVGQAEPNPLHRLFAGHLALGGAHLTTNFDRCIEKAASGVPVDGSVVHVHGEWDPQRPEVLGARISTVGGGLPTPLAERITNELAARKAIVFVGYSGSDYFDVDPYFRGLPERELDLSHLKVVWVSHSRNSAMTTTTGLDGEGKRILKALSRCGAQVMRIRGQTSDILLTLASDWNLPQRMGGSAGMTVNPGSFGEIAEQERFIASGNVFSAMGIGTETVRAAGLARAASSQAPDNDRIETLLWSGLRDLGSYKDSLKAARRTGKSDVAHLIRRDSRIGGSYWLRGNYLRAGWTFHRGRRRFEKTSRSHEASTSFGARGAYHELLLTQLHWFRDVKKFPFGWVVPASIAMSAAKELIDNFEHFGASPHNIALLTRLLNEVKALRGVAAREDVQGVASVPGHFTETDSLIGFVNSSRHDLLNRLGTPDPPGLDEATRLRALSALIGDVPGQLKAALLQRRQGYQGDREAFRLLRRVQWARWLKAAWIIDWLARSTRMLGA